MGNLGDIWHLNPALVTGLVTAILVFLVAFGVPITADQKVAVLGLIGPAWALAAALVVRNKSVPVRTIQDAGLDPNAVKQAAKENNTEVQP